MGRAVNVIFRDGEVGFGCCSVGWRAGRPRSQFVALDGDVWEVAPRELSGGWVWAHLGLFLG
jgi:hypothetical protein